MREFKFIRGKYTNENVFNSDETEDCLFAYDSKGDPVQFTEKNDKDFQEKFVGLSSDDRLSEIYTLRPSQFKISAKKESAGHYSFNFKANEKVYDGSRQFPTKVVENAETYIKAHTEAEFNTTSKLPLLNLAGDAVRQTPTTFKFNNDKTFTKNLVFNVSGHLNERGYTVAQDAVDAAFPVLDGKINYTENESNKVSGIFNEGKKQSETPYEIRNIAAASLTLPTTDGTIDVASTYNAPTGFAILDTKFKSSIGFSDSIRTINLYKEYNKYYVSATEVEAVNATTEFVGTGEMFKKNGTFFEIDSNPNINENVVYYFIKASSESGGEYVKSIAGSKYSTLGDSDTPVNFESQGSSLGFKIFPNTAKLTASQINVFNTYEKSVTLGANKVVFCTVGSDYKKYTSGTFHICYKVTNSNNVAVKDNAVAVGYNITGYDIKDKDGNVVNNIIVYDTTNPDCYVITSSPTVRQSLYKAVPVEKRTTYSLNASYVAVENKTPTVAVKTENRTDIVFIDDKLIKYDNNNNNVIDSPGNYEYYLKYDAKAYGLNSSITVQNRGNLLVKGYGESYNGLYVFENGSLRSVEDNDLTAGGTLNVYTSADHNIVNGGVYDNDAKDTKDYVMFSDEWRQTAINSKNASVRDSDNIISPIITESVLRLLTDDIAVNATQSD